MPAQQVEEATTETDSDQKDTNVQDEKQDDGSFREHTNSNEFDPDQKKFFHGYKDTIKRYKKQISTNSSFNEEKDEEKWEEKIEVINVQSEKNWKLSNKHLYWYSNLKYTPYHN